MEAQNTERSNTNTTKELVNIPSSSNTHTEIKHESTLYAEPIFHVGSFNVTNSLFTSWIVVFLLIIFAIAIKTKIKKIPKGLQNIFEIILEGAEDLCDQVTNSRAITDKAFPIVFTVFIIVLINN